MPQLDRIIVFSQIFWLFITFVTIYTLLSHFFLPLFIKSLKSRKLIILANQQNLEYLEHSFLSKQKQLTSSINKNLSFVRIHLLSIISNLLLNNTNISFPILNKKLLSFVYHSMLYQDKLIATKVLIQPKLFNLSFKN
uniref:ATP synthase F0 subunit 8 n=1 Tax=Sporolithon durum TaxID=48970 RepID=V9P5R1_9FLOR|nr:ATP synthase F0 subunit 8 [Sporolithon durum]AGU16692.1 ATP synthase F0 subunit 8 [Sporolithon durum]